MESHPIQDLLPFRLGGEELGSLDVAAEDRIRQRRRGLLGPVDDDFDFPGPDLLHDISDPVEIGMTHDPLPNRRVAARTFSEADIEYPHPCPADVEAYPACAVSGPQTI